MIDEINPHDSPLHDDEVLETSFHKYKASQIIIKNNKSRYNRHVSFSNSLEKL